MKITISFRQLEHTPSLDERIREKSQRLEKYMNGNTHVKWTCFAKHNLHYAELSVLGNQFEYFADASSDNLYKCLDMVLEKVERQVKKKNEIRKDKMHNNIPHSELVCLEPADGWLEYDEESEGYAENFYKKIV